MRTSQQMTAVYLRLWSIATRVDHRAASVPHCPPLRIAIRTHSRMKKLLLQERKRTTSCNGLVWRML